MKIFKTILVILGILALGLIAYFFTGIYQYAKTEAVEAATVCQIFNGCTGTSTLPNYGQILIGGKNGEYELVASSTFGGGGSGSVTSITTSGGITGGPITSTGNLSLDSAFGKGFFFSTTSTAYWASLQGYLTSLAGAASSTILGDNNTFSGTDLFTNAASNFAGTWQGFTPSHFLTGNQTVTLSGDITGSGATAITTTLATVNGNVGSFGGVNSIPSFTVNAKGLITAAAANTPAIPTSELTGTVTNVQLANSSVTVNTSAPLTGGASVSLGSALTLACPTCLTAVAAYPFTPGTFGPTVTAATSTAINDTGGLISTATSTLSLLTSINSTSTNATSTNLFSTSHVTGSLRVTGINGSTQCLQADTSGNVTGTGSVCGSGSGGVTGISQTYGSNQTGSIVLGTTTDAYQGLNLGEVITNSAGTFTFSNAASGFLNVGGGGTGATTFTSGQLLEGNGTGALVSVATSSTGAGTGLTFSGTAGAQVGGTNGTYSVNTSQNITTLSNLTLAGTVNTTSGGVLYSTATSAPTNGTGITLSGTGSVIGGSLSITNSGVTSIAQTSGSAQTGAVTFGTSTDPFNGLNLNEVITNSGNAFTFDNSVTGTLNSAGLTNTAVTAGSYTNTNLTVNAQGQLTAASSGFAYPFTSSTFGSTVTAATSTAINDTAGLISLASSTISLLTTTNGTTTNATSTDIYVSGESVFAATGGNVGISTTTPTQPLTIGGNSPEIWLMSNSANPALVFGKNGGQNGEITGGSNNLNFFGGTHTSVPDALINSSGFFAIATSTPTQALSVQGNELLSGNLSLANLTATGTLIDTALSTGCLQSTAGTISSTGSACGSGGGGLTGTTGQVPYFSSTNTAVGTSSLFVTANGDVTVGTTTSSATLHVVGPTSGDINTIAFQVDQQSGYPMMILYDDGTEQIGGSFARLLINSNGVMSSNLTANFNALNVIGGTVLNNGNNSAATPFGVTGSNGQTVPLAYFANPQSGKPDALDINAWGDIYMGNQVSIGTSSPFSMFTIATTSAVLNTQPYIFIASSTSGKTGTSTVFKIDQQGREGCGYTCGVVKLASGVATVATLNGVSIDSNTLITLTPQTSSCTGFPEVSATTTSSFSITSTVLTDACIVGWRLEEMGN